MGRPTKREYDNAIRGNNKLIELIKLNRKDVDKHLDCIALLRNSITEYEKIIEHNNETIMLYNLYEESENIFKEGEADENKDNT